jgi:CRP/FNR family cyclic AMP-dependent transcriptional regulator
VSVVPPPGGGDAVAAVLGRAAILAGVAPATLALLAGSCRSRRYRRGQPVFFQGDESDSLLIVVDGRLKVVTTSPDGDEMLLHVVEPGESVGEVGVLDGQPRSATVEALEDTAVVVVPADALWDCIDRNPAVARAVVRSLGATLRRLTDSAADLVFLDLPRRVAKVLVAELDAHGSERLTLGLSQTELGHRVGGTRQSVNAALRTFVRRRWIEVDGTHIVVTDAAALRHFLTI